MLERVWKKGKALTLLWECKLVQPLWKTVWNFLKKIKIKMPYYPEIPFQGIYPDTNIIWKDTYTPMFIVALFIIAKTWKPPKCPWTDEWIKMWCVCVNIYMHTHTHIHILKHCSCLFSSVVSDFVILCIIPCQAPLPTEIL